MKILIIVLLIILLVLAAILVAVRSNLCIIDNKKYIKKGGGMISIEAIDTYINKYDVPPLSFEEKDSFASYLSLFFQDDGDFLSIKHNDERNDAYKQWRISNQRMKDGDYNEKCLKMDLGDIEKQLHKYAKELNELNIHQHSGSRGRINQVKNYIINLFNAKRKKVLDDEKLAQELAQELNDAEIARSLGEAEVARSIGYEEVEHMPQELDNKEYEQEHYDAELARELARELDNEGVRQRPKSAYRPIKFEKNTPNRQMRDYAMEEQMRDYAMEEQLRNDAMEEQLRNDAMEEQLRNDEKLAKELSRQINGEEAESVQRRVTSTYMPQRRPTSGVTSTSSFLRNKKASEDADENIIHQKMNYYMAQGYKQRDAYNKAIEEDGDNSIPSSSRYYTPSSSSRISNTSSSRDYTSNLRGSTSNLRGSTSNLRGSTPGLRGNTPSSNLRGYIPSSSSMRFIPVVQKLGNENPKNISSEDIKKKIAELKQRIEYYEKSYRISPNDSALNSIQACRDNIIRLESQLLKIERANKYANSQKSDI